MLDDIFAKSFGTVDSALGDRDITRAEDQINSSAATYSSAMSVSGIGQDDRNDIDAMVIGFGSERGESVEMIKGVKPSIDQSSLNDRSFQEVQQREYSAPRLHDSAINDIRWRLPVLVNKLIGREMSFTSEGERRIQWTDTTVATLPTFIAKSVSKVFSSWGVLQMRKRKLKLSFGDMLLDHLFVIDGASKDVRIRQDSVYKAFQDAYAKAMSFYDSNPSLLSSKGELKKRQCLIGAPMLHTPQSLTNIFRYKDIPETFLSNFGLSAKDVSKFLLGGKLERIYEFTLPRSTSQGVILSTKQDSQKYRLFAKILMSQCAIAMHKENIPLKEWKIALGKVFKDRGYDDLSNTFKQGIRRQHVAKPEPILSAHQTSSDGCDIEGYSLGLQARIRGIYVPSEFIKVFLKPVAEAVKKRLFYETKVCGVEVSIIENALRKASDFQKSYLKHSGTAYEEREMMLDESKTEWYHTGAYDLSAFDTTTHKGFNNFYLEVLKESFPNYENLETLEALDDSKLLYPGDLTISSPIITQSIGNRMTLSGQPDVTTKNNIVHFSAAVHAFHFAFNGKYSLEHICSELAEKGFNGEEFGLIIHGDDAMLHFGVDNLSSELFDRYTLGIRQLGLEISWEKDPAYLKKIHHTSMMAETEYSELDQQYLDSLPIPKCLQIPGSLIKNIFGEYGSPSTWLFLAGLRDKHKLLLHSKAWNESGLINHLLEGVPKEIRPSSAQLISDEYASVIATGVLEDSKTAIASADDLRGFLDRIFYSGFESEEMIPQEFKTLYGSLHYDPFAIEDPEFQYIQELTGKELLQLISHIQELILDMRGDLQESVLFSASRQFCEQNLKKRSN